MKPDFFNLLYHGYTGEYQLVSALYRNGLDAVRPPADMGIDVVSLNLKEQLENPNATPETFFFQVKTAVTSITTNDDGRKETVVEFKMRESELDILCQDFSRALVCYIYTRENDSLTNDYEAPFCCFWIDGMRLLALRESNALFKMPGDQKLTLQCKLTLPPADGSHWYAAILNSHNEIAHEGYLGTIDSDTDFTQASDGADHYSIKGYLDYARKMRWLDNLESEMS